MSPPRRTARTASAALILAMVLLMGFASGQETVSNVPTGANARTLHIGALEEGCPDGASACWDIETLVAVPGDEIFMIVDFSGSAQPHDFQIEDLEVKIPDRPTSGGVHTGTFTFPANADSLDFFCSVHETTMNGRIVAEGELGGHATEVPHLGVNFLSYWVGVIAFMILFVVYGATFFLFKYNETPNTTDHWDRPGTGEGAKRFSPGVASIIALAIAAVIIGGVVYAARLS